ncbi:MAG: multifunctional oxoglutarate decarboxylase/oxoglutarate dehydrogenase thiamine pyrophosphate-binding subunit/dihydrolipoyllysine-residue succinyltransferase subunit [Acidimicrobiia bacterium]|nr:multifunctional oxoglutarate decarboxylase/oxoglutarate dehydrogenase thiamine pyrophosphate-binding subunit/dihydrolipoyllysine-residue succinyltransferase subunit [Acidimicrobiia bacterium]
MTDNSSPQRDETAFGPNASLVDDMYRRYLADPTDVPEAWREFFVDYEPHSSALRKARERELAAGEEWLTEVPPPADTTPEPTAEPTASPLRLGAGAVAKHMITSLEVPTATSVRTIPAKLLEVNRELINAHLGRRSKRGRVSFSHLVGWAFVRALVEIPDVRIAYSEIDGQPHRVDLPHVNLAIAISVEGGPDAARLVAPNIKNAHELSFFDFWMEYEDLVERARQSRLTLADFEGTTHSITNPGIVGTSHSVPRLMTGQALIVGVGAVAYPAERQGSDPDALATQGVSKVMTLSSTYDHRVIQGADSGRLLARIEKLLIGGDQFYDEIFESLGVRYTPARWAPDDWAGSDEKKWAEKQVAVSRLITAYRIQGHLIADLDPLRQHLPTLHPELDPGFYGLTIWDLERRFGTGGLAGSEEMPLKRILARLRSSYCDTLGFEYMHIADPEQKRWIQQHVEIPDVALTRDEKLRVLRDLNKAEAFETFLHTKYVGHKRFGLEGAESLIPLLDAVAGAAATSGATEMVMGMAHRGRLNVLANIVGKGYAQLFREFQGDMEPRAMGGSGDVKYHLGAEGTYDTATGPIDIHLVANPSHLEAIDPVLEGVARAKQERLGPEGHTKILPLLIHGDAAFAGQGVVVETLNLSQLPGYQTGGTVHVVVNNQVGFTTSTQDARSSHYATDVAKAISAPIIHVNADHPEDVVRAGRLAVAYRNRFARDIVIDLVCYRRRGHNEGDEPSFTQPLMYKLIDAHTPVRRLYLADLVDSGDISIDEGEAALFEFQEILRAAFAETQTPSPPAAPPDTPPSAHADPETRVSRERLERILVHISSPPEGFVVHPKLVKLLENRRDALTDGIDWAIAEALAFGTLAEEGVDVRLAGEDSTRGTFSHRHAAMVCYDTGTEWIPLAELTGDGYGSVEVVDSLLSEYAAVGFEYGYSIEAPSSLVIWEAQFGDFANGAQVVIDEFVASGEARWGQASGLVLLLPHGHDGQGPDHSSGRLERFLQLSAEKNMRVVVPSTTGQYFHLLRRQALLPSKKPLVVFTPKTPLRTRTSFSSAEVFTDGRFEPVLVDPQVTQGARRVVLCAGKVHHDLVDRRAELGIDDVALIRVAQLYPLATDQIAAAVSAHPGAELVWCQEEPENQGAYRLVGPELAKVLGRMPEYAGRKASASTASGLTKVHLAEQAALVDAALGV